MTVTTGFFDAVRQYSADEFARVLRALATPGVVAGIGSDLAVTAGPGLGVTVAAGFAAILGYWYYTDATQAVALLAADPTNPRIDRIIIRLTISTKTVILTKLTGTPAGSPAAPTLTQGSDIYEVPLAQVAVAAAAASITAPNLTDQRQFAGSVLNSHVHTVAAGQGGVVPHGNLSGIGTNTHAQLDTHLAAAAAVHALPASVNVLGNRNAAGEFIQRGGATISGTTGAAESYGLISQGTLGFSVAFSAAPIVLAGLHASSNARALLWFSVTTTGFDATVIGLAASAVAGTIKYIALGT